MIELDGKSTINKKNISIASAFIATVAIVISQACGTPENTAIVQKVDRTLINDERFQNKVSPNTQGNNNQIQGGIKNSNDVKKKRQKAKIVSVPQIKLMAKQIITRSDLPSSEGSLPTGTNFIGKLISTIDTRDQNQFIKALLPYGGSFKGKNKIPKDTVLLGSVNYPGTGEKVFVNFVKAIFPDGQEIEVNAQALNPQDYSTGILGDYHGTATVRIATTLGLSMVSGMTEVLTEKQALGESGTITPKSTMKNAFYHGVSKVSEMEANRQAGELSNEKAYVTVDAGNDLIVSLIAPLKVQKD